jgi:hypothetical protein
LNIVFRYWVAFKRGFKKKVRKFVMRRKKLKGFGWQRWSREDIYQKWGLFYDYRIEYISLSAPDEGKPHVRFDEAGDGEVLWRNIIYLIFFQLFFNDCRMYL